MSGSNPYFNAKRFSAYASSAVDERVMTLDGTLNKCGILLVLLMGAAIVPWVLLAQGGGPLTGVLGICGFCGILLFGIGGAFMPRYSPYIAPLYALSAGLLVGTVSAIANAESSGIVLNATMITVAILFTMLALYKTGIIKATQGFMRGVCAATGAVFLVSLVNLGLNLFGMHVPYLWGGGPIGIVVCLVIIVIAALNLILDFNFIEQGVAEGAPQFMEWYAAFGLIVTLVWLYIRVLRLLSILGGRR